jgi:hypothetical protein
MTVEPCRFGADWTWLRMTVLIPMSTPSIIKTIELQRHRRRLSRRAVTRVAWLAADLGAIAACAVLALHG